jgi:photosystem II stability/assembly factor-like uncharacterized protein
MKPHLLACLLALSSLPLRAADEAEPAADAAATNSSPTGIPDAAFAGLKPRLIGPALMSGRIGDFAVNPRNPAEYFVAVASGGVWKTVNGGTTYRPVFDSQGSYSIGCVTLDPQNPNAVWVGSGENNGQRSVGFGDGVYVSRDGGQTWRNVGLTNSEHIGRIVVHPTNSDFVYVAAQGPLWKSGGDRGLYRTEDGGKKWKRILFVSDDTGINEVHMDPRDPNTLYASAWQRRRHVWTLVNGGAESAIYKSTDGGTSWRKLTQGVPDGDKGRIGLAVSPANPDYLYAIIEASGDKSGVYRSVNRGESWERRSSYITASPQYYNEVVCDPVNPDRVYVPDTFTSVSEDGGKTFRRVGVKNRHVDDHALWINPAHTDHLRIGGDGGLYETWDRGENWQFKANLPVTQFYRVSADDSKPFYRVFGGTQDNNSQAGPSRTTDRVGIPNESWFITVGGDGYETVPDAEDSNILYCLWQYGGLVRYDCRSGEVTDIKPREQPGEPALKWNWDSPLIQSPHQAGRLYFAANKLYRSDDRGNSWTCISEDLTRGLDRDQLPVFGRLQSVDAVARHRSTSPYGNAVSLTESPIKAGLVWVGTDDGLIHLTMDDGKNWTKFGAFPGVPTNTYVSCLTASRHATNTVFAAFDNHKHGDFKPYLLRSDDLGQTWTNLAANLPEPHFVLSLAEDHERPDLLFVGTELGAWFTLDGGRKWRKFAGLPTIAVRDLELQHRENDLIFGTFGRGIYILDDYSPLRRVTPSLSNSPATIFPVKDALRYVPQSRLGGRDGRGSQGASYYSAANPPFGAVFTYYLPEKFKTLKERRQDQEKKDLKAGKPLHQLTFAERQAEQQEREPQVWLVVRDDAGKTVRRLPASRDSGLHRVAWDLRFPSTEPLSLGAPAEREPWEDDVSGLMALPGTYTVSLARESEGEVKELGEPVKFNVIPLELATFAAKDKTAVLTFQQKVARLQRAVEGTVRFAGETETRLNLLRKAVRDTPAADPGLLARIQALSSRLTDILTALRGDPTYGRWEIPAPPSIRDRVNTIVGSQWRVTAPPTQTEQDGYRFAAEAFGKELAALRILADTDLKALEAQLEAVGAPYTPGRLPEWRAE